jgi:hypothetical protein
MTFLKNLIPSMYTPFQLKLLKSDLEHQVVIASGDNGQLYTYMVYSHSKKSESLAKEIDNSEDSVINMGFKQERRQSDIPLFIPSEDPVENVLLNIESSLFIRMVEKMDLRSQCQKKL